KDQVIAPADEKYFLEVTSRTSPNDELATSALEARYCNIFREALAADSLCPVTLNRAGLKDLANQLQPLLENKEVTFPKDWPLPTLSMPPGSKRNLACDGTSIVRDFESVQPMEYITRTGL